MLIAYQTLKWNYCEYFSNGGTHSVHISITFPSEYIILLNNTCVLFNSSVPRIEKDTCHIVCHWIKSYFIRLLGDAEWIQIKLECSEV